MGLSFEWDEQFPKGYGHTSIAYLKRCPGYENAKNGDLNAARFVVSRCIKQDRITDLKDKYPNAILIPVLGDNQLPLALAMMIGLPITINIYLIHTVSRKLLCAMQRLLHKPVFIGYIKSNSSYIIVDDIVAQGGTVASLRELILFQGGDVVAVVALAYSFGSNYFVPIEYNVVRLLVKFGSPLIHLLNLYGIATSVRNLTNSQIKYLLRFSSLKNIEKRLNKFIPLKINSNNDFKCSNNLKSSIS